MTCPDLADQEQPNRRLSGQTPQLPLPLAQVNVVTNVTVTGVDISQLLSQALAPNATGNSLLNPLQQQIRVDPAQNVSVTPTGVTGTSQVCPYASFFVL